MHFVFTIGQTTSQKLAFVGHIFIILAYIIVACTASFLYMRRSDLLIRLAYKKSVEKKKKTSAPQAVTGRSIVTKEGGLGADLLTDYSSTAQTPRLSSSARTSAIRRYSANPSPAVAAITGVSRVGSLNGTIVSTTMGSARGPADRTPRRPPLLPPSSSSNALGPKSFNSTLSRHSSQMPNTPLRAAHTVGRGSTILLCPPTGDDTQTPRISQAPSAAVSPEHTHGESGTEDQRHENTVPVLEGLPDCTGNSQEGQQNVSARQVSPPREHARNTETRQGEREGLLLKQERDGDSSTDSNGGSGSNSSRSSSASSAGRKHRRLQAQDHWMPLLCPCCVDPDEDDDIKYLSLFGTPAHVSTKFVVPSSLFLKDSVCRFFVYMVLFLVMRAGFNFAMILLQSRSIFGDHGNGDGDDAGGKDDDNRCKQNQFLALPTFLFYCVPLVLLHAFAAIIGRVEDSTTLKNIILLISALVAASWWTAVALMSVHNNADILEITGACLSFFYIGAYVAASVYFPYRLSSYGEGLRPIARRIRLASIVFALFFVFRAVIVSPRIQDKLVTALSSDWYLVGYMLSDLAPVVMTMYFLHTRQESVSGGASAGLVSRSGLKAGGAASTSSGGSNSKGTLQSFRTNNNSIAPNGADPAVAINTASPDVQQRDCPQFTSPRSEALESVGEDGLSLPAS